MYTIYGRVAGLRRTFDAETAQALGLVNEVVSDERLIDGAAGSRGA